MGFANIKAVPKKAVRVSDRIGGMPMLATRRLLEDVGKTSAREEIAEKLYEYAADLQMFLIKPLHYFAFFSRLLTEGLRRRRSGVISSRDLRSR